MYRVRTAVRRGGHFCCSFVANLLRYPCDKTYENILSLDKVIAKIIGVQFFASQSKRSKVKEIIVLIKARSFLDELNLEHLTS